VTRSSHVSEGIAAARPAIERICAEVWDLAEISLHEVESSRVHVRELAAWLTTDGSTEALAELVRGAGE